MRLRLLRETSAVFVILVGLFLALSSWMVGDSTFSGLAVNNLITGLAFIWLLTREVYSPFAGTVAAYLIAMWTVVSPWPVWGANPLPSLVANTIAGAVMVLLSGSVVASAVRYELWQLRLQQMYALSTHPGELP